MTASELRSVWQQYPDIGGKTIQQIANAYDILPHTPEHVSYAHFVDGITRQYRYLQQLEFKVIQVDNPSPYETSTEMFADIRKGKLKVSITGSQLAENHPLSYHSIDGLQMNVMFRAVHDVFGHHGHPIGSREHYPFETFEGELKAFRRHRFMFLSSAHPALFSETVAQLAWYYTHGDHVPLQKCVIYPDVNIISI